MRKAFIAAFTVGVAALAATGAQAAGTSGASPAGTSGASAAGTHGPGVTSRPRVIISPGVIRVGRTATAKPPTTAYCQKTYGVACFEPDQLRAAYNLPAEYAKGVTGKGATIVIVDSYGSPTIAHDLAVFDRQFGYPAPPSLKVITPAGKIPKFDPASSDMTGWAGETTLDVEYAHTVAPGASILVVETPVSETEGVTGFPQIVTAEKYVLSHNLGDVISQSFSATEQTFAGWNQLAPLRAAYELALQKQVPVLAASGDSGAADVGLDGTTHYTRPVTSWPDSDPLVTAVGGTRLAASGRGVSTAGVWNDTNDPAVNGGAVNPAASGGGRSIFFTRPRYQDGVASVTGGRRGVPDIAMSGACNGAVVEYSSYPGVPEGWGTVCGTSEATPEFAGVVALATQAAHRRLGLINPVLYLLSSVRAPGLVDVTRGNNTVSFRQKSKLFTVRGFSALPGYDLASGVGTIDARYFVSELAEGGFMTAGR